MSTSLWKVDMQGGTPFNFDPSPSMSAQPSSRALPYSFGKLLYDAPLESLAAWREPNGHRARENHSPFCPCKVIFFQPLCFLHPPWGERCEREQQGRASPCPSQGEGRDPRSPRRGQPKPAQGECREQLWLRVRVADFL